MDCYRLNKNKIIEYIKSGEKAKKTLGLELEHIIVEKDTFNSVAYEDGVNKVMAKLLDRGWQNEGLQPLLHLNKDDDIITLEPGAQLELSVKSCEKVSEIEKRYFSFIDDILPILEEENYQLLSIGYRPVGSVDDVPLIPKLRYKYMSEYLINTGKYAINMMKGTAALQLSVDYADERDYIKKNRVANFLSPAISYLFDNTPIFEGEIYAGNTARIDIWNNMDDDRSKLTPGVLDREFGYEDYSEYVLNAPCVISLLNGEFVYTGDKLAREVYKDVELDIPQIEHLLSMYFPDVRTKKYIEIRMSDSVPYPYNMSAAVLWKGILYNSKNLDYFYQKSLQYDNNSIQELKDKIVRDDQKSMKLIRELISDMFSRVGNSLDVNDKPYLEPLFDLYETENNLACRIKRRLRTGIGLEDALVEDIVKPNNC